MPKTYSEPGVTFTANPLWHGSYDEDADSADDDNIRWTSNPLTAPASEPQMTANPLWHGGFDESEESEGEGVEWAVNPLLAPVPFPKQDVALARGKAMAHFAEPAEDNWWDAPAPRVGAATPPAAATRTGISDQMASREMDRRRAMQGMSAGGTIASGFGGHSGGKRLKPTVAPAITDDSLKDADLMRHVASNQRNQVRDELAELGGGRAPGYRGKDEATADARAIVDDPRFAKKYALERDTDRGNGAKRYAAGKKAELSEWWNSGERGKRLGKAAARTAARKVPVVGSGLAIGGAVKEHQRAAVDDRIAADPANDDLTRNMATAFGEGHRKHRNKEAVSGAVGLIKTAVDIGTGGTTALLPEVPGVSDAAASAGGSLIDKALNKGQEKAAKMLTPEALAWRAAGKGGTAFNKAADKLLGDEDALSAHQLRPAAVAPQQRGRADLVQEGTDAANVRMQQLFATDAGAGAKMLEYLNADMPALDSTQHILDQARASDTRSGEHNLKPSQVARMMAGEGARQRQRDRMGDTLGELTSNEQRSWWESSAGADVNIKK